MWVVPYLHYLFFEYIETNISNKSCNSVIFFRSSNIEVNNAVESTTRHLLLRAYLPVSIIHQRVVNEMEGGG